MAKRAVLSIAFVVLLTLAVGCGTPAPTSTAVLQPTQTSPPPTDPTPTAVLQPTQPPPPPTNTPPLPPTAVAPTDTLTLPPTTQAPTDTPQPPATTATPVHHAEGALRGAQVTFVNNAGFLITVGDRKILIDALYRGEPVGVLNSVAEARPPFDAIDLILVTHDHPDHFSPDRVASAMSHSPEAIFVSSQRVVERLLVVDDSLQDRAIPIQLQAGESEQLDVNGIGLEALYISHGDPNLLNLGFVITVGDVRFFHTGDNTAGDITVAYLQSYGLPEMQLDVAFVPYFYLTRQKYHAYAREGIQARYVIPMHYETRNPPLGVEDDFPNAIVFHDTLERWMLPSTSGNAPSPTPASTPANRVILHTHVCGFLVDSGGKRILVDSLFQVDDPPTPGERVLAMRQGLPPFNDLDLILVTHDHHDHFDANLVGNNMLSNPNAVLVSTDVVVNKLQDQFREFAQIQDRVIGIHLEQGEREQLNVAGIDLDIFFLSHGVPTVPNFGYFFEVDDISFFHTGDMNPEYVTTADLKAYGLPERKIDIAFVSGFRLVDERFSDRILEGIQSEVMVPMHFNFTKTYDDSVLREAEASFENVILFHEEMTSQAIDLEALE